MIQLNQTSIFCNTWHLYCDMYHNTFFSLKYIKTYLVSAFLIKMIGSEHINDAQLLRWKIIFYSMRSYVVLKLFILVFYNLYCYTE